MKTTTLLLAVIGLMLASLSACGSAPAAESSFPTGKFVLPNSEFEGIYFEKDGTWYAFYYGDHPAEGTYSVKGDIYIEETNNAGCTAPMEFRYTFDGANLTFNYVDDSARDADCSGRQEGFNDVTYVLAK